MTVVSRSVSALLLAPFALFVALPTAADTLYGAAHTGGQSAPSTLYTINPGNGTATSVGPIGFDAVGGMDFQPVTGILYGVGKRASDGEPVLFTIDTLTGLGQEVGPLVNVDPMGSGGLFDISFRHADGKLYLAALVDPDVAIFTVDVSTGTATLVGTTGFFGSGNGLGFALSDVLRLISSGDVADVDPATGGASGISTLSFNGFPALNNPRITALDFRPVIGGSWVAINDGAGGTGPNYVGFVNTGNGVVTHVGQTVNGLDALAWQRTPLFEPQGRVYAAGHVGGPSAPSTLYEVDPTTGSAVEVGPIGFNAVGGLDFDPDTRRLYGVGKRPADDTNVLIRIDTGTGQGTEVGPLVNVATPGFGGLFDLSFRADATLYLTAILPNDDVGLYSVDSSTGLATLIGDTTTVDAGNGVGFAFDDSLYLASGATLYDVDPSTGAATVDGAFGFVSFPTLTNPRLAAFDFNPISGYGLAVLKDGSGGGGATYVGVLDPASRNLIHLGPTAAGIDALAWRPGRDACDVAIFGTAQTGNANSPSFFYEIDPDTGVATSLGPVGFNGVGGLALEPTTRTLYAVARRPGDNTNVLITINPGNGAGSEIGPLLNTGAFGGGHFDITFRRSDGTLFLLANDGTPLKSLFTVDTSTGEATFVGNTGTDATGNGIVYSLAEVLYHGDTTDGGTLRTINPATGVSTALHPLSYAGFPPLTLPRTNAMDIHPATGEFFVAVNDGSFGDGPNYLASLDATTGLITHIGRSVNGLGAIAVLAGCDDTIPCTIDTCEGCQGLLYGASFIGGASAASQLVLVDPRNGSTEVIGPIGFDGVSGMDFHPVSGLLYAAGKRRIGLTDVLIAIDPTTGWATEIGPFVNTDALGDVGHFDLSFRESDGALMLTAYDSMAAPTLFQVDLASGEATPVGAIGSTGIDAGTAFSPTDQLYHADDGGGGTLYDVDTADGSGTAIETLSYVGFPALAAPRPTAVDYDPCNDTATVVIDDGTNGSGPNYLATLDPTTGDLTFIAQTRNGLNALAWRPVAGRNCINTSTSDDDGDGLCTAIDNCPQFPNPGQNPVLFPETILATGPDVFSWTTPTDIARISGSVATLSSYLFGGLTFETASTGFVATDPPPGETRFFLVRVDCDGGSWSSGGTGECPADPACPPGARDGNLP